MATKPMEKKMDTAGLGAAGVAYPDGQGCAREKFWHEKTAEEKFLKLGEAVEYLTRELRDYRQELAILRGHEHQRDGRMVVPVLSSLEGRRIEESYFYRNPLGRENHTGR